MRAVLKDWHRYRRGRARARGAAERHQRTPQTQRVRRRDESATLGFARGRGGARGGRHKWSPPLTHTTCELCTSPPVRLPRCALTPHTPPRFERNLAAHLRRVAANRSGRVMQDGPRRFGGFGTGENHRAKVVLVASSCCAALSLISHAFLVAQRSGGCCDRVCTKAHNKGCSNR